MREIWLDPKSILLVEDNPDDEQMTLRALRRSEIPSIVRVARDGVEAIEALFRDGSAREFDLVILDLQLPKMSGLEVLERIRQHPQTLTLPVVVMTTSDETSDVSQVARLNANSYVKKPIDFPEYLETVQQLAHYWLVVNHAPRTKAVVR